MTTDQYKIRLSTEMIQKLRDAAARFGVSSGNQIASEVIEIYFDFWIASKEAQHAMIEKQRAAFHEPIEKLVNPPKKKASHRK